jgi:hypothetical protein
VRLVYRDEKLEVATVLNVLDVADQDRIQTA